eukprot:11046967-Ditylum_brightwellii.AAC.1
METPPPTLDMEALQNFTLSNSTKQAEHGNTGNPNTKGTDLDKIKSTTTTTTTITTTESTDVDTETPSNTTTVPHISGLQNNRYDSKQINRPTRPDTAQVESRQEQLCKTMAMLKAAQITSFLDKTQLSNTWINTTTEDDDWVNSTGSIIPRYVLIASCKVAKEINPGNLEIKGILNETIKALINNTYIQDVQMIHKQHTVPHCFSHPTNPKTQSSPSHKTMGKKKNLNSSNLSIKEK